MVSGTAGFAADFVAALASDFAEHGADAISALRQRDPNAYLRICASVLPREAAASDPLESLTDEQLAARIGAIADRASAPRGRRQRDWGGY